MIEFVRRAALLQLVHDALQTAKVCLCQHLRDESRHGRRLDLTKCTCKAIENSHQSSPGEKYVVTDLHHVPKMLSQL
jgi:hypothetical protein